MVIDFKLKLFITGILQSVRGKASGHCGHIVLSEEKVELQMVGKIMGNPSCKGKEIVPKNTAKGSQHIQIRA